MSFSDQDRARLRALVESDALLHGDFALASGQTSSFYFDSKPVTLSPEGASLVAQAFLDVITKCAPEADAVGGLTLGADPIVSSIVVLSHVSTQPLKGLIVRKEKKDRGTTRWVEGPVNAATRVVVVEDVATSGGSARQAVERLRESDLDVVLAIALIDRLAGFEQTMQSIGVPSQAILTIDDFGERPTERPANSAAAISAT